MAVENTPPSDAAPATPVRRYGPLSAFGLSIVFGIIAIDQVAKWAAEAFLPFGRAIPAVPFLSLYLTYNPGIAFSLLAGAGALTLVLVTGAISAAVIVMWGRSEESGRWAAAAYALIVGGALGNLIDRLAYGHVIDYLLLHYGDWTLFVFNLADAALTIGPVMLLAALFIAPKPK